MGIKEFIQNLGEKRREKKELFRRMEEQMHMQQMLEDRQKSANERELIRFEKEAREQEIKEALEDWRNRRREDISLHHNPLNTKNIMKAEWSVLKERNQFAGHKENICNQPTTVMRNNKNLLKNNRRLFGI